MDKNTKKSLLQVIAFAVLLFCIAQRLEQVGNLFRYAVGVCTPFILGGSIAFILNVPMKKIEAHLFVKEKKMDKFRRPLAYLLTLFGLIGIFILGMTVIIPQVGEAIGMLVEQIPQAVRRAQQLFLACEDEWPVVASLLDSMDVNWQNISSQLIGFVRAVATGAVNTGYHFFSGVFSGAVTFIISFTFSIYILFQKEKLSEQAIKVLYAFFKEHTAQRMLYIGRLSNRIFSSFLSGQCVEAVILGTMFVVTMAVFRMPYAVLVGIVIAFTALIPMFGAFIGCTVGAFLILIVNPLQAVVFLIMFFVLQQIEGNLIYPHVVGNSVGLPSIWVLVAVSLGGDLFGVIGILVFIPLCSVLYTLFREFVYKRLAAKKVSEAVWTKKPQETEKE